MRTRRQALRGIYTDEHDPLQHLASIRTVRYWAKFEEFVARHLAARIALYGPQGVNASGFSLQELLWSAAAPAVRFRVPQAQRCRVHRAEHRWLASNDNLPDDEDCLVVLCAPGTPAVDIVVLLRREDGSRFYLSVQVKHTRFGSSTPLDLQTVRNTEELFRRKLGSMRKRRSSTLAQLPDDVYLAFITNRDTPSVAADALPARTAVLDTETFMGATFACMLDLERLSFEAKVHQSRGSETFTPRRRMQTRTRSASLRDRLLCPLQQLALRTLLLARNLNQPAGNATT